MSLFCHECGSNKLRRAHLRFSDATRLFVLQYPVRCRVCRRRCHVALPEPVRDASSIDWKPGMRAALTLAIPAGLLSSGISPLGILRVVWMLGAATAAVLFYMRSQRPAWITIGAGARIGLVTGLMAAWLAFGVSGAGVFIARVVLHHGDQIDTAWRDNDTASQQMTQQWVAQMNLPNDAAQANAQRNWMLSPEGHAGFETAGLAWSCFRIVFFAVGGWLVGDPIG